MTVAAGTATIDGSGPLERIIAAVRRYLPALLVAIAILVIWETTTSGPGRRVLPAPSKIVSAAQDNWTVLQRAVQSTFFEAMGGLVIGTVLGLVVAFAAARWMLARDVVLPIAIASSSIPIIAVAPILNNWFGVLSPLSKMAMAALLVFFPVMLNVTRGLTEVHPSALELMRSYAANEFSVLRKVRVPNMLPFFFTALKVGATLSFIGAVVGEYFGGSSEVLGYLVLTSMSSGAFDLAWASILSGAFAAIVAYVAISLIERYAIPWREVVRAD
jgi:NitT/TauT family transport system permease protein